MLTTVTAITTTTVTIVIMVIIIIPSFNLLSALRCTQASEIRREAGVPCSPTHLPIPSSPPLGSRPPHLLPFGVILQPGYLISTSIQLETLPKSVGRLDRYAFRHTEWITGKPGDE